MEYIMSIDSVLAIITGAIIGGVAGRFMKGLGLIGNIVIGLIGGLIGGYAFDLMSIIDVGDYADPVIAGLVGSVILLAIVGLISPTMAKPSPRAG